jgi:hypothetical protein
MENVVFHLARFSKITLYKKKKSKEKEEWQNPKVHTKTGDYTHDGAKPYLEHDSLTRLGQS